MLRTFIDRPIFATVVSIIITLGGALALLGLPVEQYPLYLQGNPIGSAHNPKKCQASLVTAIMTAFATHTGSANVAADPATAKILKKFIFVFKRETKPSKRD